VWDERRGEGRKSSRLQRNKREEDKVVFTRADNVEMNKEGHGRWSNDVGNIAKDIIRTRQEMVLWS